MQKIPQRFRVIFNYRTAAWILCCFVLWAGSTHAMDLSEFGAVPDDGKDDTAAFVAAFAAAQTNGATVIRIPPGKYLLRADGNPANPGNLLSLARRQNLTIEGQGAELLMTGSAGLFSFSECSNVTVLGLKIDWERPPFSEGTVVATAPRYFDIKILDAYPVKGGEPVGAFMSYHADTRLPDGRDLDVYDSVERTELVAPQVLRVHLKREIAVPVGRLLVLRHRVYGHNAFVFHRCATVKVRDVTVYCAPGMGLVAGVCTNVSLDRFDVRLRPGSGRLMSATADATHFGGCKGTVTLEDCFFEGMGDDGANIKSGLYLTVRQRLDDHTVLGQHNLKMVDMPDPGDTLEMAHVDTLSPFASGQVRQVRLEPGEEHLHRVEFAEPLPAELKVGDVLGNASRAPKLRMLRCTVRANRARGVLCQTRDALIDGCVFQHCTSAGVLVLTETVHFYESIGTRNVTVSNCRFEGCNSGGASAEGALCAVAYLDKFAFPIRPGVHRDVAFIGNHIEGTAEAGIFAVGVDGLRIRDNRLERCCERPVRESGHYGIRVQNCARLEEENNSIASAPGTPMAGPISILPVPGTNSAKEK